MKSETKFFFTKLMYYLKLIGWFVGVGSSYALCLPACLGYGVRLHYNAMNEEPK